MRVLVVNSFYGRVATGSNFVCITRSLRPGALLRTAACATLSLPVPIHPRRFVVLEYVRFWLTQQPRTGGTNLAILEVTAHRP